MSTWYYAQNGQQIGPVEFSRLQALVAAGQLTGADLVWTEGMSQWQTAAGVAGLLSATPPVPVPSAPAAPVYSQPSPYVPPYSGPSTGYGAYYQPPSKHANLALTSMILSLVSLACGGILLAIPGAICGGIALKGMKQTGDYRNKGFAQTGFWVGIAVSALTILGIIIYVVFAVIIIGSQH